MTHQQKLEAVRQACIKANPAITAEQTAWEQVSARYFELTLGEEDDISTTPNMNRPVRLADVLNALMYTEHVVCIASNERFEIFNKAKNNWEQAFKTWRLNADDLSAQPEETISFLYELLK